MNNINKAVTKPYNKTWNQIIDFYKEVPEWSKKPRYIVGMGHKRMLIVFEHYWKNKRHLTEENKQVLQNALIELRTLNNS